MNAEERTAAIAAKEAELRASGLSERLGTFGGYYDRASRPMSFVRWVATVEADPESRIVGKDILEDGTLVSTVWLGLDHRHRFGSELDEGAPLIFETMIFGPSKDESRRLMMGGIEMNAVEQRIADAFKPFGWSCGSEFWKRYYSDAWIYNLTNAIVALTFGEAIPDADRATRWKAEVVDEDDNVLWEVLAHDMPAEMFRSVLFDLDVRIRRVSTPRPGTKVYDYSVHDPVNSIKAAREHAARRETQLGNVLMLLLDRDGGWVSRDEIRRVGGEEGPRRWRELRKLNWPVEIKQLAEGEPWHVRLNLPGSRAPDEDEDTDGDGDT